MAAIDVDVAPSAGAVEVLRADYASWSKRVGAFLLDTAVISATTFLVAGYLTFPQLLPFLDVASRPDDSEPVNWVEFPLIVIVYVLLLVLQAYTGATIGKRAVGIVVVNAYSGRPVGLASTLLRLMAHCLDGILLIGYLRPLWNDRRQTFADSIMSTVVLDTRRPQPHPALTWLRDAGRRALGLAPEMPPLPGAPVSPGERRVTALAVVVCLPRCRLRVLPDDGGHVQVHHGLLTVDWPADGGVGRVRGCDGDGIHGAR